MVALFAQIDPGSVSWPSVIAALSGGGFSLWYGWYTTSVTLPKMQADNNAALVKMNADNNTVIDRLIDRLTSMEIGNSEAAQQLAAASAMAVDKLTKSSADTFERLAIAHGNAVDKLATTHAAAVDKLAATHAAAVEKLANQQTMQMKTQVDIFTAEQSRTERLLTRQIEKNENHVDAIAKTIETIEAKVTT